LVNHDSKLSATNDQSNGESAAPCGRPHKVIIVILVVPATTSTVR